MVLHSASYHINTSTAQQQRMLQRYAFGVCHGSPLTSHRFFLGSVNLVRINCRTGGPWELWAPVLLPPDHQEGHCCHRRNRRTWGPLLGLLHWAEGELHHAPCRFHAVAAHLLHEGFSPDAAGLWRARRLLWPRRRPSFPPFRLPVSTLRSGVKKYHYHVSALLP